MSQGSSTTSQKNTGESSKQGGTPRPSIRDAKSSGKSPERRVTFQADSAGSSQSTDSTPRSSRSSGKDKDWRRQSIMGTSGYVTGVLDEYLPEEYTQDSKEKLKPIRSQSDEERRMTIQAVESDMVNYLRRVSSSKARKSSFGIEKRRKSSIAPHIPEQDEKELVTQPKSSSLLPHLTSEWKVPDVVRLDQESKCENVKKGRSWVGAYIVGTDYWTPKDEKDTEKPQQITFAMDEKQKMWYDMPIERHTSKSFEAKKGKKKKAVLPVSDEEFEKQRKLRITTAALARERPERDAWSDEFREIFREFAKADDMSSVGTHITLAKIDKWLEKADILDYDHLTLVHTGFCFLSVGGSRYRGIDFDAFTSFLQMIAHSKKMPLWDLVRRMVACQRIVLKHEDD